MKDVRVPLEGLPVSVDLCGRCHLVWFDRGEFEESLKSKSLDVAHTQSSIEPIPAPYRTASDLETATTDPEKLKLLSWETCLGLMGLPVEHHTTLPRLTRTPMITWGVIVITVLMSLLALEDLLAAVQLFAFLPTQPFRSGGITLLSSFFVHAGLLHLIPNMYFLGIFGDNVEMKASRLGVIGLLFGGHLAGMILHGALAANNTTPVVGASAGISAIIVYYALSFPKAKISVFLYFRWLQLSSRTALICWIILQSLGSWIQVTTNTSVSYLAHLGGAITGALIWYFKQKGLQGMLVEEQLGRNNTSKR